MKSFGFCELYNPWSRNGACAIGIDTYIVATEHRGERVGGHITSRAHREGVGDAENRIHGEDLGQVRAETREHHSAQRNVLLHFSVDILNGSGVREAQGRSSL